MGTPPRRFRQETGNGTPVSPEHQSLERRIIDGVWNKFKDAVSAFSYGGKHIIARKAVNSTEYNLKYRLPKDVSAWRMVNEGTSDIRWATNDRPPDEGERAWSLLPGKSADSPTMVPAHEGEPIDLWMRIATAGESTNICIMYTTSTDPRAIAQLSALNFGLNATDIQIGAVEIKDGSGDQRVTITSGPDGVKYIETDASGSIIYSKIRDGSSETWVTVTSGSDGIKRLEVSAQITSAEIQIGAVELKDGSSETRVTVTSGGDGVKYIETDISGAPITALTSGPYMPVAIRDSSSAVFVNVGVMGDRIGSGIEGINALALVHGINTSGQGGLAIRAVQVFEGDPTTDPNTSSMGLLVVAENWAWDGLPGSYRPVAAVSILSSNLAILSTGDLGMGLLTAAKLFGEGVGTAANRAGLAINVGSSTDGIVYIETDASGSTAIAAMKQLGTATVIEQQGNSSGIQYVTPIADATLGLVYSGVVSFASGAGSGTIALATISAPAIRTADDQYVIDIYPNTNTSTDVRVFVNRVLVFNSAVRRPQVATFIVEKAASGESNIVEGWFSGGTTGELLLRIETAAVEPISCEINVYRL